MIIFCAACGKRAETATAAAEGLPSGWSSVETPYGKIVGCSADHAVVALDKHLKALGEKATLGYLEGAPIRKPQVPS